MDEAFMRRFLYKIELTAPTLEVRLNILKDRLPFLNATDIKMLGGISFTGAQLENILSKRVIYKLKYHQEVTGILVKEWLENELDGTPQKLTRIGF